MQLYHLQGIPHGDRLVCAHLSAEQSSFYQQHSSLRVAAASACVLCEAKRIPLSL